MKSLRIATSLLLVTLAACAVPPSMPKGSTVDVKLQTGSFLRTLAARKTSADINHYHVKLVSAATNTVVSEADTTSQDTQFTQVPDGTYRLKADAFDSTGASLVQGGEQTSGNTATVASPAVSYSDNSNCLKVDVALLNATGEAINNHINVTDGQAWTGIPTLVTLPSCACSPSPAPGSLMWTSNPIVAASNGGTMLTLTAPGNYVNGNVVTTNTYDPTGKTLTLTWTPDQTYAQVFGFTPNSMAVSDADIKWGMQSPYTYSWIYNNGSQYNIGTTPYTTLKVVISGTTATYFRDNTVIQSFTGQNFGTSLRAAWTPATQGAQVSNISITLN